MRPISAELEQERAILLKQYADLIKVAEDALQTSPLQGRPNWHKFHGAHEMIWAIVKRIRDINLG